MPDQTKQSVSASQAAALFNVHPYYTKFMLWHHFKNDMPLGVNGSERIVWGKLLQDDILYATSLAYRLEVTENTTNEYVRSGRLGATIDGRMMMPGRGPVVVEAKNVDWLRWKQTWTETAAAAHVEIQVQVQMLAAGTDHGIIAALIGGNEIRWLERERNGEIIDRLREEAAKFFASLERDDEPDPLGSAVELPFLATLYPDADPTEVIEDYDDEELALALRQYERARSASKIETKTADQIKALILGRAGTAGILRTNGFTAYIKKSSATEGICEPHDTPKVIRKGSVRTTIEIIETQRREPAVNTEPMGI